MLIRSRFATNTLYLVISHGLGAILSFLLAAMIGRSLGESGLGYYASALAWVFPISLLADFGISTLIVRDAAKSPERGAGLVRFGVWLRWALAGGLMVVLALAALMLESDPTSRQVIWLAMPLVLIQPLYSTYSAIFRAQQRMGLIAVLHLGMLGSQVVLTAVALLNSASIQWVMVINTVTSGVQMAVAWWLYRQCCGNIKASEPDVKATLQAAAPFALAAFLGALQLRLNVLILDLLAPAAVVGVYAAAARFVDLGTLLARAVYDALYPALSAEQKDEKRNRTFYQAVGLLILGSVGLAVVFTIGATWLISLVYGGAFSGADDVLAWAGWALLPNILKNVRIVYWYARGQEAFTNWVYGISIGIQIVLGLLLIPTMGALGAVLAGAIADSISALLLWLHQER
ncbi:MAG: oligosaccharide flippase family protein [Anaerolineae bacterium]|nr:oligosaccharide flippase family protein [Anaerolineae bacterium]